MKELKLNTQTIKNIHCYVFDEVENPKGIVQIVHGMQTHAGRYADMGNYLCKKGFIVYACDSKGHGKNVTDNKFGVGKKDLFKEIVFDTIEISKYLKAKYNLPLYVFGHSYGSFIVQNYMTQYDGYDKAVLCGTRYTADLDVSLGNLGIDIIDLIYTKDKKLEHLERIGKKIFGRKFKNENWLTRDDKVYEDYKKDKMCGNVFPVSFYKSLFENMKNNYKNIDAQSKNKPVFIIAGSDDPVSRFGKGAKKLHKFYNKNLIKNKLKIYNGARHELFNETNKYEIFDDIISFFNNYK